MNIRQFFTDIRNLGKTKKFWTGLAGVVAGAIATHLASQPELGAVFQLLGVLGVYQVRNGR